MSFERPAPDTTHEDSLDFIRNYAERKETERLGLERTICDQRRLLGRAVSVLFAEHLDNGGVVDDSCPVCRLIGEMAGACDA